MSTVENQLGIRKRRQLLTLGQWNVRTLLDPEGTDRPEKCTQNVAMEMAKHNIDIAALWVWDSHNCDVGNIYVTLMWISTVLINTLYTQNVSLISHVENKLDTIFDNVAGENSNFSILAVSLISNSEGKNNM